MALVPKFTPGDIEKYVSQQKDKIEAAIINRLQFVGEKFIANARSVDTYKDRTGNLRSSIGYIIIKDGQQIFGSFPGATTAGKSKGLTVAEDAATKFPSGIVLIVVAGMDYAAAVESRNYDVLTASSIEAESALLKSLNELKRKIAA
jgi:hypothetical protein